VRKSAYESDRTLIGSAVFWARITVDYETVHLEATPGVCGRGTRHTHDGRQRAKRVLAQQKTFLALYVLL